jgi:hypothetical protein
MASVCPAFISTAVSQRRVLMPGVPVTVSRKLGSMFVTSGRTSSRTMPLPSTIGTKSMRVPNSRH